MKRLLIIPARGGSKRLPGKNIRLLNGKPLIFYTIDAAIKSNIFDKIIFTSDDKKILDKVSENYSIENLELIQRDPKLASDQSKVIDTVVSLINLDYEETWLSLPTSPFKVAEDFIKASELLDEAESVISFTDMEFPPSLGLKRLDNDFITDHDSSLPWQNGNSRSQDHPEVFRPNGAIYGAKSTNLLDKKNYYIGKVKGYYMPRERSIDIDTQFDFDFAEFTIKNYH